MDHNKLRKILKDMGIPDHLTCLLRNLYAGQEATVKTGHVTTDWFQIRPVYCHPACLTYIQSTSCKMPGWMKHKLESRLQDQIRSVTQSCPTVCDPMDCSLPDFFVGFPRQEYWNGLPFSSAGESSRPRGPTRVSCIAGRFFK